MSSRRETTAPWSTFWRVSLVNQVFKLMRKSPYFSLDFFTSVNSFQVSLWSRSLVLIHLNTAWCSFCKLCSQLDDEAGYTLGCGYLVIDKSLAWRVLQFSVGSSQDIVSSSSLLSKYAHFLLQRTKLAMSKTPNSRLQNATAAVVHQLAMKSSSFPRNRKFSVSACGEHEPTSKFVPNKRKERATLLLSRYTILPMDHSLFCPAGLK